MMKEAIWRAVPAGDYRFHGSSRGQLSFELGPSLAPLQRELQELFGQVDQVPIKDLEEWVMSDATNFHHGHLRRALKALEADGAIDVVRPPGKRRGTFTPGTAILFVQR